MSRIFNPNNLAQVERGDRLGDIHALVLAIQNSNCHTSAYNIIATGNSQATAVQLIDVINEVDSVNSGTGIQLPSTQGKDNTPFQFCIVINNGVNTLQVYSRYSSFDNINNIDGRTGITQSAGTTNLYVSARNGYWFSISGSGGGGGGGGINRLVLPEVADFTMGSVASTDYVYLCNGTLNATTANPIGNTNRYSVENVGSGTVTIIGTVNGITNLPIGPGNGFDLISNGTTWNVL